jgi:hypothetical protein
MEYIYKTPNGIVKYTERGGYKVEGGLTVEELKEVMNEVDDETKEINKNNG